MCVSVCVYAQAFSFCKTLIEAVSQGYRQSDFDWLFPSVPRGEGRKEKGRERKGESTGKERGKGMEGKGRGGEAPRLMEQQKKATSCWKT